jgi:hypothetical protein
VRYKIAPRAADVVRSAPSNTRVHRDLSQGSQEIAELADGHDARCPSATGTTDTRTPPIESGFELRNMTASLFRPQTRAASKENYTILYKLLAPSDAVRIANYAT